MAPATTTKILVIGGTGYVGKFMVGASAKAGYPTFTLLRDSTLSNPHKSSIIQYFKTLGVHTLLVRFVIPQYKYLNFTFLDFFNSCHFVFFCSKR